MTAKDGDKLFSSAMLSALQTIARLKGDSTIAWTAFQAEGDDDRHAPGDARPRPQGSDPVTR